jgi:hypothetical protein
MQDKGIYENLYDDNSLESKEELEVQILEELKAQSSKILSFKGIRSKSDESQENFENRIKLIQDHIENRLTNKWECGEIEINNTRLYKLSFQSYYNGSDYQGDNLISFIFPKFLAVEKIFDLTHSFHEKQREAVLRYYNRLILNLPLQYDNYNLLSRADTFATWYIDNYIGNIGFSFKDVDEVSGDIELDYSFFDKFDRTPEPLPRHLKEYLDSLDNEFNFVSVPKVETNEIRDSKKIQPAEQTGFNLGYSETQLKALHKALMDKNFLDNQTEEAHFINAFNGEGLTNFEKLKWIDETQRTHHISIHTVFQLLDSCKIDLKGEYNIIPEVRETIKDIFENDFGNIQSKYNDFVPLKTPRHKLIDSIVKDLTLNLNKI